VLLQIEVAALKGRGEVITQEREEEILNKIRSEVRGEHQPLLRGGRLWLDAVIDPLETRKWISMGIEAAQQAPAEQFNMGVLQT
jgi:3-methylcrotonyl-CoA carboxylase beta subunit